MSLCAATRNPAFVTLDLASLIPTSRLRLPDIEGDKPEKKKFKSYPFGYFYIDIAKVQTEEVKLYLFVAIERTSKYVYTQLHEHSTKMIATGFLRNLLKAVPDRIHTVLTDNGIQFANHARSEYGIEHRLTKPRHS